MKHGFKALFSKWFTDNSNIKNKIKFLSQSPHVWNVRERPVPSSKYLPDWWKSIPQYSSQEQRFFLRPYANVTVKKCMPAGDALTAGYVVPLWTDVHVEYEENEGTNIRWATTESPFSTWNPKQVSFYEFEDGFEQPVFKYHHGWTIETPKGWSSLIIHPIGYPNLPFKVIPGIVDTDNLKTDINTPMVFKKGWSGILERGTPMFQVIPIKRKSWTSEVVEGDPTEFAINQEKLRTKVVSYYAKTLREAKKYS